MDPEALKELEYPTPRHLAVLDEAAPSEGDSVYNSREISIDRMALKRIIRHGLQSTTQTRSFFSLLRAKHKELSAQNERFILTESGFERQFAQTYFCRFHELKPHLVESAQHKWPEIPTCKILGIKERGSTDVVLCGILFKSMKLKPQVLDKYLSKRVEEKELQINKNRVHDDDLLFIEDDGTRTELTGTALPVNQLVSGMCVAVKGRQLANGRFEVTDVCCPGKNHATTLDFTEMHSILEIAPQLPLPEKSRESDVYLLLLSGLNLATIRPQNRLALDMLAEYLVGSFGEAEEIPSRLHSTMCSVAMLIVPWAGIVRVVVCGELIGKNKDLATGSPNSRQQLRALEPILSGRHFLVQKDECRILCSDVDGFLNEIVPTVPVDVMPGLHDLASCFLPQQPLHKCFFPQASKEKHLNRVTNPHDFTLDGVRIMGTSGQNVDDILLHSDFGSGVEAMELCLKYRHLAPTCPDTLTCFPFDQSDPFVLEETPHIFFAGNQPCFDTRLFQDHRVTSRLISVPDFSLKSEAVLVNLHNLETQVLRLDAALDMQQTA